MCTGTGMYFIREDFSYLNEMFRIRGWSEYGSGIGPRLILVKDPASL
jgi:hypothetical protein